MLAQPIRDRLAARRLAAGYAERAPDRGQDGVTRGHGPVSATRSDTLSPCKGRGVGVCGTARLSNLFIVFRSSPAPLPLRLEGRALRRRKIPVARPGRGERQPAKPSGAGPEQRKRARRNGGRQTVQPPALGKKSPERQAG